IAKGLSVYFILRSFRRNQRPCNGDLPGPSLPGSLGRCGTRRVSFQPCTTADCASLRHPRDAGKPAGLAWTGFRPSHIPEGVLAEENVPETTSRRTLRRFLGHVITRWSSSSSICP